MTDSLRLPEFAFLLQDRYSCRAFRPEEIPHPLLETVFTAAQRSASWCNVQPWQVLVVSGPRLKTLSAALLAEFDSGSESASDLPFPAEYVGRFLERRRECGKQLYTSVGIPRGDRDAARAQARENFRFFGAPHVAIVTTEGSLGTYAAVDVGGFVQTLMLAMRAAGIASIAQAAIAGYSRTVRTLLQVPESTPILCGISFGFEDKAHPANSFRTTRAQLADAVKWIRD